MTTKIHTKINDACSKHNLELISNIEELKVLLNYMTYKCPCKNEHTKTIKEFLRKPLKQCCSDRIKLEEFKNMPEEKLEEGVRWRKYEDCWISEEGKGLNLWGKELTRDDKGRFFINKKHEYISRVMAKIFKIKNYEKLTDQTVVVSFVDGNNKNLNLSNLKVITKSELNIKNGEKSRQSEDYKETMNKSFENYKDKPYKTIYDLPEHIIFEDGSIYNINKNIGGNRFIVGSKSEGYNYLCTKDKTYKIHRIVCMAFKPIEGKNTYDDYKDLQVNHIDGDKLNNSVDNLEWVTQSENMNHAYKEDLNKKKRVVLQYENKEGELGSFIREYDSLAEASRKTEMPEFQIREICKGKCKKLKDKMFLWRYKNEEETEEYSKKFSRKVS